MSMPRILLIIIDYHSADYTRGCISTALATSNAVDLQIRVVDNAGLTRQDNNIFSELDSDGRLRVLCPGSNLGYFGGAQWALEQENHEGASVDWVVVSNPDIRFMQADFFSALDDRYAGGNLGVVAPSNRISESSLEENPFMQSMPSRMRMRIYRYLLAFYPVLVIFQTLAWLIEKLPIKKARHKTLSAGSVYAAHGSCLIFSRNYFEKGGDLRHHSFLYGEEIFVAETCGKLKLPIMFAPELEVVHLKHATTGVIKSAKLARWEGEAARRNYEIYFRRKSG